MKEFMNGRVLVKTGDITQEAVDAVVNAANSSLMGGGGVDGAIHRAGGPSVLEACKKVRKEEYPNGLPTGQAVITTAGNMPAKHVIHTVGPVWHGGGGNEERLLGECYLNSLKTAADAGCLTVAFPAISTGVYGYPKKQAAHTASSAVKEFLDTDDRIRQMIFVFFSQSDAEIFLDNNSF